jgi:hypothetical protein
MLRRFTVAVLLVSGAMGAISCGGNKLSKDAARQQLEQLLVLYKENKPKFVAQKQEMEQDKSCDRATAVREAMDEKAAAAAMSPDKDETITMVKMELEQAEKTCKAK